jgi:hypothetical protein
MLKSPLGRKCIIVVLSKKKPDIKGFRKCIKLKLGCQPLIKLQNESAETTNLLAVAEAQHSERRFQMNFMGKTHGLAFQTQRSTQMNF